MEKIQEIFEAIKQAVNAICQMSRFLKIISSLTAFVALIVITITAILQLPSGIDNSPVNTWSRIFDENFIERASTPSLIGEIDLSALHDIVDELQTNIVVALEVPIEFIEVISGEVTQFGELLIKIANEGISEHDLTELNRVASEELRMMIDRGFISMFDPVTGEVIVRTIRFVR